uniref:Cytochrome P450 n=1 Tax=Angiostrongylus cantonensis TaxID=6313 RepID=A0A0K0DE05_ANGCA
MEETTYGERLYSQALFLTDLYSGYSFARALTESPDLAIIVRHVMDIFGSFGPPEAYRTFTLEYSSVIADVMLDIERMFKIAIKNMGVGGNLTRDLVHALYRRAESELLSTNRWVEALPFAVVEQNQRPSKFFDSTRTPFEIMFGRHAWRDELCPPWVSPYNTGNLCPTRGKLKI